MSTDDIVGFGEKLLSILDRGSFTATYKYAVLLGLLDLALEKTSRDGAPPTSVTTTELAEAVVGIYWPHTRIYPDSQLRLAQNLPQKGKRPDPEIIRGIVDIQRSHPAATTAHRARTKAPDAWASLLREVEWKLVEMPLPRLQVVGQSEVPFLL